MADIGQVCRRPVFQDLDLARANRIWIRRILFQFNVGLDPGAFTSRRTQSSQ